MKNWMLPLSFMLILSGCGSTDEAPDTDKDGIADAKDNCVQIANADQLNSDGDSAGDACDAFPNDASETKNFDGDALGDNADPDDDNDGYNDDVDEFPLDATEWADADQDRIGDNKDLNLTSSNPNSAMLERIFETGGAIKFISPQDKFSFNTSPLGAASHNIGDVNGDQLDDFLIGYSGYVKTVEDVDYIYVGIAYLLFGREEGWPNAIDLGDLENSGLDYVIFESDPEAVDLYGVGYRAAAVGDVNEDGIDDFLLSATYDLTDEGEITGGEAYLIFGRKIWNDKNISTSEIKNQYAITYYGNHKFGAVGGYVKGVGDMNGDSIPDFLVGEPGYNLTEGGREGRSVIIWGGEHLQPPNGTAIELTLDNIPSTQRVMLLNTHNGSMGNSSALLSLKDMNNDQMRDLAFGSYQLNEDDGQVTVLFGKETWPDTVDLNELNAGEGFVFKYNETDENYLIFYRLGYDLAAGDLNGDGHQDLVVSSPALEYAGLRHIENAVYILWGGRESWPSEFYAKDLSLEVGATIKSDENLSVGMSVTVLSDANSDGKEELLIGAPFLEATNSLGPEDDPLERFARVFKINGRDDWSDIVLSVIQSSSQYEQILGLQMAGYEAGFVSNIGDFNRDGFDDFIMDVPNVEGVTSVFYLVFGYAHLPQPQAEVVQ